MKKNNPIVRDGFAVFKYRLKVENEENIIKYIVKVDGNKYVNNNLLQCSYIDYLVEKLSKMINISKRDIYKKYMPVTYKNVVG